MIQGKGQVRFVLKKTRTVFQDLSTTLFKTCELLCIACVNLVTRGVIGLIFVYQKFVSPSLRPRCRFVPSCSSYAIDSLKTRGLVVGGLKAIWRLARCHPFCKGGYDPP